MHPSQAKPVPASISGASSPRLIVCDLDGTLLGRGGLLSRRNLRAVQACHDRGILFAVATARSRHSVDKLLPDALPVDATITSGGALAYIGAQQIHSNLLPAERADALAAALFALHGQGLVSQITLHSPAGDFSNLARVSPKRLLHNHCYADFSLPLHRAAMSLTAAVKSPDALSELLDRFSDLHHLCYRGERLHRFSLPGSDKGSALAALCARLDIPLSQVWAFGDDVNDRELLAAAGWGVAMGDAIPSLIAMADDVCPPVSKDGVGRYLEKHVLHSSLWSRLKRALAPPASPSATEETKHEEAQGDVE